MIRLRFPFLRRQFSPLRDRRPRVLRGRKAHGFNNGEFAYDVKANMVRFCLKIQLMIPHLTDTLDMEVATSIIVRQKESRISFKSMAPESLDPKNQVNRPRIIRRPLSLSSGRADVMSAGYSSDETLV